LIYSFNSPAGLFRIDRKSISPLDRESRSERPKGVFLLRLGAILRYYLKICFPMTVQTHQQLAAFIWSICNLLRGPYKRNEYRKVILPLTVLRRFDSILAPTKAKVLEKYEKVKEKPDKIVQSQLCSITGRDFYNISKLDFPRLLG
jgi:hypothetical protein